jgi:UrcA family protein
MSIGIIAALAALASSAPGTHRLADEMPPTRIVKLAGLDLATPQGVRVANHRVVWTINEICKDGVPQGMTPSPAVRQCRKRALAQANGQLNIEIANANARHNADLASR